MDDVQQMIVNELQRLDRAIQKRTKDIEHLKSRVQLRTSPRRYVLEYEFPSVSDFSGSDRVLGVPIVRSFIVDRDSKRFCCQEIACSIAAVGQLQDQDTANKVSLPPGTGPRGEYPVDFTWLVRDTATDREWQNQVLPRYFLASGLTSALSLPCTAVLSPGTELEVTLTPTQAVSLVSGVFTSINSYAVQIAFIGFEVL
jgi:hypothetical protein